MPNNVIFSVFRYQLLPTTTEIQQRLDGRFSTYQELLDIKNELFKEIVSSESTTYRGKGYNVLSKVEHVQGNSIFLRMGVRKTLNIHDEEFRDKKVNNYPNSLVYINNHKDKQFILIEQDFESFSNTEALKNIIEKSIKKQLAQYNLTVYIEKITNPSGFWETVMEYQGMIKTLSFEFFKPNMSNISGKAVEAIKILRNDSNSHKTKLELNAPENGVLENINPDNEEIANLVDYKSQVGGNTKIKIKGYRRFIKTNDKEEEISIENIDIENKSFGKIKELLDNLFTTKIE